MDVDFECTACGRCCHDLKLPLSVAEAAAWLARGHEVQILCEAIPWPGEPPAHDLQAAHKRRRSFQVLSGSMPVRVVATLAASFRGACPNLSDDLRCGIYAQRPNVCRIYPAEINPFIPLVKSAKACPPQAWEAGRPALMRGGTLVDAATRSSIEAALQANEDDVDTKARLCAALGIRAAAMANEGFAVHAPGNAALSRALSALSPPPTAAPADWLLVSNVAATLAAFAEIGAVASRPGDAGVDYLDFAAQQ
jgi:Fe-S-cluster containining protein